MDLIKYPKETMGQNVNNDLLEVCHKIFTIDIKQYIHQGISKFRNWKVKDNIKLRNDMFYTYHRLEINSETEKHRQSILGDAFKIGGQKFVDQIKGYKSTIVDTHRFEKILNKAFWDMVTEKYSQQNYEWIYVILEHILNIFKTICPSKINYYEEIIDIPFIRQRVEHGVFEDMEILRKEFLNIIKSLHAPIYDVEIEKIKNTQTPLPIFLKDIVERGEEIIKMILILKNN